MLEGKERGSDLPLSPTTTPSSTGENSTSQGTGSQVKEYVEHPYYQIHELIDEGYSMVLWGAEKKRTKKGYVSGLTTAARFIDRVRRLLPFYERQGCSPLAEVISSLRKAVTLAAHTTGIKTLADARAVAKDVKSALNEASNNLAAAIVVDEDRDYPGCRTEEGEFLEDQAARKREGGVRE
jgi:hypothetical protein